MREMLLLFFLSHIPQPQRRSPVPGSVGKQSRTQTMLRTRSKKEARPAGTLHAASQASGLSRQRTMSAVTERPGSSAKSERAGVSATAKSSAKVSLAGSMLWSGAQTIRRRGDRKGF